MAWRSDARNGQFHLQDNGDHLAALEMDRNAKHAAIRLALGLDAAVLDAATKDASARDIGEAFGYAGKTAERQGIVGSLRQVHKRFDRGPALQGCQGRGSYASARHL